LTKLGLTNLYLASLPAAPPGKRQIIWDGVQPNFGIRTTEHGVKSFVVAKRPEGSAKLTMVVLGKYTGRPGGLSLAEARRKAQEVLATLATGVTPAQARVQEQAAQEAQQRRLFATVAEAYIAEYLPRLRSSRSVEARIRNKLLSRWSDRPIAEIDRRDVVQLVKEISAADGPEARARPCTQRARYSRGRLTRPPTAWNAIRLRVGGKRCCRSRSRNIALFLMPSCCRSGGRPSSWATRFPRSTNC
jgi:Arm DNA-binding domain